MSGLVFIIMGAGALIAGLIVAGVLLLGLLGKGTHEVPGASGAAAGSPGVTTASWNAELLGTGALGSFGSTLGSTFGTMHVENGMLSFVPTGEGAPAWWLPCHQLVASKRGLISMNGADIQIQGPYGVLQCNVSREHINRLMENDFKALRERGYADEFLATLQAHGARVTY